LIGLTDPAQHRTLRIWLAHGSGLPAPAADGTPVDAALVKVDANAGDAAHAKVCTQLSQAGTAPLIIRHDWAESGGAWYFKPPKLRSAAPPVN